MDTVEKELDGRKDEIIGALKDLFQTQMKFTDWNVPEPNNQKAAKILVDILQEGLDVIKEDIQNNKF